MKYIWWQYFWHNYYVNNIYLNRNLVPSYKNCFCYFQKIIRLWLLLTPNRQYHYYFRYFFVHTPISTIFYLSGFFEVGLLMSTQTVVFTELTYINKLMFQKYKHFTIITRHIFKCLFLPLINIMHQLFN